MKKEYYTMKEACKLTGLSYDTLKFYTNEGLIPNVKRNENNYRIFDENNINWIKNLSCLKKCGMSIKEMKTYIKLCQIGKSTIKERQEILNNKKIDLENQIKEIQKSIDFINWKQNFYEDVLNGKRKYFSYLNND